jgi:hypothetical protein
LKFLKLVLTREAEVGGERKAWKLTDLRLRLPWKLVEGLYILSSKQASLPTVHYKLF